MNNLLTRYGAVCFVALSTFATPLSIAQAGTQPKPAVVTAVAEIHGAGSTFVGIRVIIV